MGTTPDTTALDPAKGCAAAHTPVSKSFNRLVACLDAFVSHEQRLEAPDLDVLSHAFKTALADAEHAREALCEVVGEVLIAPDYQREDRSLRRLAHVLYVMITMEDDGDRQHFYTSTLRHRDIFEIDGRTAAAGLTRRLSQSFFSHFDDLANLPEVGGDGPVACLSRGAAGPVRATFPDHGGVPCPNNCYCPASNCRNAHPKPEMHAPHLRGIPTSKVRRSVAMPSCWASPASFFSTAS